MPTAQVENTNPKRIIRIESHPCLQLSSAKILSIHVLDTGSTPRFIAIGIAIAIEISRLSDTKSKIAISIESRPCLQASSAFILSIDVPIARSTPRSIAIAIAIGFAIAIETSRLSLSALSAGDACLRAPPVCVPRLSACDAQAGTGRRANGTGREHEIQKSRLAASFRKTSGPTNWERIDSDPDSDSDSEKNGCRQEIYGANLAKGCLPCQTQRIARLSFRGFSSTARTRRPV